MDANPDSQPTDAFDASLPDDAAIPPDDASIPPDDASIPPDAPAADSDTPSPMPPAGYPTGPYGTQVGDTLPYLEWQGYVTDGNVELASAAPFVPYTTDDVRASGAPYALVHVAEFHCLGCQNAAGDLSAAAEAILDAGGAIVEVLGSHGFFTRATREHLDAWIDTHDLAVTSVIDGPGLDLQTIDAIGIRETALIVDTSTMEVVWRETGDLGGVESSSIDTAVGEMMLRLSP